MFPSIFVLWMYILLLLLLLLILLFGMDTLAQCVSVYFLHPFCTCCLALHLALLSRCIWISGQSKGFAFSTHSYDRHLLVAPPSPHPKLRSVEFNRALSPFPLVPLLTSTTICTHPFLASSQINRANSVVLFALIMRTIYHSKSVFFFKNDVNILQRNKTPLLVTLPTCYVITSENKSYSFPNHCL